MASIRKRGKSYLIVVSTGYDYLGNRKKPAQKTVHPPESLTEKQVEKWLNEQAVLFEHEVKHEQLPPDSNITLYKYYLIWKDEIGPKRMELSSFKRIVQDMKIIIPELGGLKLKDINAEILQGFYDKIRRTKSERTNKLYSEKTISGLHRGLSTMLTDAVKGHYLQRNPALGAYIKKGIRKEPVIADEETIKKLFECLEQEQLKYELYFKLLVVTGMRRGEAASLHWCDIDFKECSIFVHRNIVDLSGEQWFEKGTKSEAGNRVVYVSDQIIEMFKRLKSEDKEIIHQVFDRPLTDDDYVFLSRTGNPIMPGSYTYKFNKILKKYNLPKGLTVHSLRHTNASLLIAQNVDIRTVANLLGHAQPSTTLNIYAHAFDSTKRAASERLRKVLKL